MTDDFNDEQHEAINHPGSVVLSADAGSGKTRVLVARYAHYLEQGAGISNLVAITFTHKSTREMRDRIRRRVKLLPGWNHYEPYLETADIDTIHGFCSRILKLHATSAGIGTDFTVIDDSLAAVLKAETTKESLQALLLAGDTDLQELVVIFGWQRIVESIEGFLATPDPAAWQEFVSRTTDEITERWVAAGREFIPRFASRLNETNPAIEALQSIRPATDEGMQVLVSVLEGVRKLCKDPFDADIASLNEAAKVGHHTKGKKLYGTANYDAVRDGFKAIREEFCRRLSTLAVPPRNLAAAAEVSLRMTRVAIIAQAAYSRRKRNENCVDFGDLLLMTRDLLRSNEPVRSALRNQYQFLLLDELQDTDPVQMEIVELLLGDRLKGGGLFAVGDIKQSIYRFRGAEVSLFDKLRLMVPSDSRKQLVINYRSRPGILRFVNALCQAWFPGQPLMKIHRRESARPEVEFLWTASEDHSVDAMRTAEAESIANRIVALTRGDSARDPGEIVILFRALTNTPIYENALRNKGIDYYLAGSRAYFAQQEVFDIANVLRAIENPLDHLSVAGVLRSPIGGLSDDAVAILCRHTDGPWMALAGELETVPASERETARRAWRNLSNWRHIKDSIPVAWLLQRILADSEYDAALHFEPLGERKLANLWKLQEIARTFDRTRSGLAEFAQLLVDQIARQPREEQAATAPEKARNIVRLMTIHQAKGLEFPVVIVPDLNGRVNENSSRAAVWHPALGTVVSIPAEDSEEELGYPEWPHELAAAMEKEADDAEGLRVLYVACTRAEELLILSSGVMASRPIEPSGPALSAIARVFDLTSGKGPGQVVPVTIVDAAVE